MTFEDIVKLFYFMTYRNFWRYAPKNGVFTFFGHISAILGLRPTTMGLQPKKKKLHMTFEDIVKLFYFMSFFPKLHILATRVKKSGFFTIFGHISAILEDFLTEMEKS